MNEQDLMQALEYERQLESELEGGVVGSRDREAAPEVFVEM